MSEGLGHEWRTMNSSSEQRSGEVKGVAKKTFSEDEQGGIHLLV